MTPFNEALQYMHFSYNEALIRYQWGYMSERAWNWYCLLWEWSAVRFSSYKQEHAWKALGPKLFYRRINRIRKLAGMEPINFKSE